MKKIGWILLLLLTSNIYSETILRHTLPPEPDPKINNLTLLGIDVNDNGVRDVERYIYKRFGNDPDYSKTKVALVMQYAICNMHRQHKKYLNPLLLRARNIWMKP